MRTANNLPNDFWALCALICAVKPECHSGSVISIQSVSSDLLLSSVLLPPDPRRRTSRETPRPRTERQLVCLSRRRRNQIVRRRRPTSRRQKLPSVSAVPRGWSRPLFHGGGTRWVETIWLLKWRGTMVSLNRKYTTLGLCIMLKKLSEKLLTRDNHHQ